MSDLMLAASWSKKPTKIEEQPTVDDEEVVAESFITTEQHYPTASLCEIVHEIENFPLASSKRLSHPAIQIDERDTISPFSSETPIIIHRTILTRQETDRWPQEESQIIEESTEELEKIEHEVRSHADDWTNSSNQRKEVYGEHYRPERKFSQESPTEEIQSKYDTEQFEDQTTRNILHDTEERDENEQSHIERTWSTEKILEPSSTIESEHESLITSPYEVHEKLISNDDIITTDKDQQSDKFYIQSPQTIAYEQSSTPKQSLIETQQGSHEEDSDAEDHFKLETQFSDEKLIIESSPSREEEDRESHQMNRLTEEKVEEDEQILEEITEGADAHKLQTKLNTEKIDYESPQLSEHEDEADKLDQSIESKKSLIEDEHEFQPTSSTENIKLQSHYESDHEEEAKELYESKRKHITDEIIRETSPNIEQKQFQHPALVQQNVQEETSDEEMHRETESNIQTHEASSYKSEKQFSPVQTVAKSSFISDEDDQSEPFLNDKETVIIPGEVSEQETRDKVDDYKLEQRRSSERPKTESPQPREHDDETHQFQYTTKSKQILFDEKSETEEKPSSRSISNISSQHSEHEDKQEDDHHLERQRSVEETALESSQSIERTSHEDTRRSSIDEAPITPHEEVRELSFEKHRTESLQHSEDEDEHHLERQRSVEETALESSQSIERTSHEDTRRSSIDEAPITSHEEVRELSFEKHRTESLQHSEDEDEHHVERQRSVEETVLESSQSIERTSHEDTRRSSIEKFRLHPHEEVRKSSFEKQSTESLQHSEHEDEQEEDHHLERQHSSEELSTTSQKMVETEEYDLMRKGISEELRSDITQFSKHTQDEDVSPHQDEVLVRDQQKSPEHEEHQLERQRSI
ncbi:hypothetical protein I4U23_018212 [Adineta vaga]|nr:hypothetical protein I4U23_018212 [Adineta vaga]